MEDISHTHTITSSIMEDISPWSSPDKQVRPPRELKRTPGIELELEQFIEKPVRKIRKLDLPSSSELESAVNDLLELPRFGPFFNGDDALMLRFKEATWQHVVFKSPIPETETTTLYKSVVQKIGKQARNTYPDDSGVHQRPHFISMMVKDGCFILQIALFLLGGENHMDYPKDHLIFGENRNTRFIIRKWAKSLFFVGNQVPQIVLKELMDQTFFRQVLSSGSLKRPSYSFGSALYDLLLEPGSKNPGLLERLVLCSKASSSFTERKQPSDLLHGLHLRVIGAGDVELEEGEDCAFEGDLEGNNTNSIQCATELRNSGIHFKRAKAKEGIRGMKFTSNIFRAVIVLPTLEVDGDTELMFRYLQNYEVTQMLPRNKREVRSYLQFMSELVHTSDDADILYEKGIIPENRNERKNVPAMLRSLANGDSTPKHQILRIQINDYSRPPWDKLRNFLSIIGLLTILQTFYTVLGYYKN